MPDRSENSLYLDRVEVAFGSLAALREINLTVSKGESLGLIGMSGAGKTTLLRLFNGMVRPTRGRIVTLGSRLDALSFKELRKLRSRVGFVHQELHLIPNLSALQNVLAGRLGQISTARALAHAIFPSRDVLAHVHHLLDRVGIGEKLYQRVDRLSGGERQRVAIARALYQGPEILLADEPVSSVDPARARSLLELLTQLAAENSLTLCVSLHNVRLAREFFPRLVGMRAGQIVFDKPTRSISEEEFQTLYQI
jgi:phosphonate transport system ATP-binding protein